MPCCHRQDFLLSYSTHIWPSFNPLKKFSSHILGLALLKFIVWICLHFHLHKALFSPWGLLRAAWLHVLHPQVTSARCCGSEWHMISHCLCLGPSADWRQEVKAETERKKRRRTLLWDFHMWLTLNRCCMVLTKPFPCTSQIALQNQSVLFLFPSILSSLHTQNTTERRIINQECSFCLTWVSSQYWNLVSCFPIEEPENGVVCYFDVALVIYKEYAKVHFLGQRKN